LTGDIEEMMTEMTSGKTEMTEVMTPQRTSHMVWNEWAVWLVIGILLVITFSLIVAFTAYVLLTRKAQRGRRLTRNTHWIEMEEDQL
jgi:hypothetical protein